MATGCKLAHVLSQRWSTTRSRLFKRGTRPVACDRIKTQGLKYKEHNFARCSLQLTPVSYTHLTLPTKA